MNPKGNNEYCLKINKNVLFLLIILLFIVCTVMGLQAFSLFEKDDDKNESKVITYTDKEVRTATIVELSNFHRSTIKKFDPTSSYDQNLYNLDVYITSAITTKACLKLGLYNDDVEAKTEEIEFDLLKDTTVVKSTIKFDPTDFIYNGESFEDANLSWDIIKLSSGECE